MKIIPVIVIFLVLLTGCLDIFQTKPLEEYHIIEEKTYNLNDIFHGLIFNLPGNNTYGATVSITIIKPNGDSSFGTYRETILPLVTTFEATTPDIILYYPGLWHVDYEINVDETIQGSYNFWVADVVGLERFEVENCTFKSNQLSLTVRNIGKEAGYVNILVYNDNPSYVNGTIFYGKEYINEQVSLRPGFRETYSVQITDPNPNIKVRLNNDVYEV